MVFQSANVMAGMSTAAAIINRNRNRDGKGHGATTQPWPPDGPGTH